jgi:hypothetical protein
VWTAGVQHPGLTCPHIPVPRPRRTSKYAHAYAVLRAILDAPGLPDTVVISDDDMFALAPHDPTTVYTRGPLGRLDRTTNRQGIVDTMRAVGPDAPCLDTHRPTPINRPHLAALLDALDLTDTAKTHVLWRTLHGTPHPTPAPDCKVYTRQPVTLPDSRWVSTTTPAWDGATGTRIRARYPTPSPWEKA